MESKSRGVLDTPLEPVIGLAGGETRWRGMTTPLRGGRNWLIPPRAYRESSRIIAAPFSAIIAVGVLVLPEVIVGITEASATRRSEIP